MKRLGPILLGAVIALYMLFVTLGAMMPGQTAQLDQTPKTTTVLLAGGVIHYDFLLPLNDVTRARLSWLGNAGVALDHPEAKWLVVGWGARDFYTTVGSYTDLRARTIWRGLTGDTSVMRIDLAGALSTQSDHLPVMLSGAQYGALLDQIEASFAQADNTQPLEIDGLSGTDVFFPARGQFNFMTTCNVWIGQTLRAAGVRFGIWTPLPISVSLSHNVFQRPENQKP
jgi:uncharacterized protein (TIGR02117 family)